MRIEFKVEYISEAEREKVAVLQKPVVVYIYIEGDQVLADAIIALIKTKYETW